MKHDDLDLIKSRGNYYPRKMLLEAQKMADRYGTTWLRAYECASMMLRGTPAFGGPDAVKASYRRVAAADRDPKQSWQYFIFEPEFLESIGLQHPSRWPQSSKIVPLYKLTL